MNSLKCPKSKLLSHCLTELFPIYEKTNIGPSNGEMIIPTTHCPAVLYWRFYNINFLPDVVAQIWLDPLRSFWGCLAAYIILFFEITNDLNCSFIYKVCTSWFDTTLSAIKSTVNMVNLIIAEPVVKQCDISRTI